MHLVAIAYEDEPSLEMSMDGSQKVNQFDAMDVPSSQVAIQTDAAALRRERKRTDH
jgi:hypothetical protein